MYENKNTPLISRRAFKIRLLRHIVIVLLIFCITLAIGVSGHMMIDGMAFIQAFIASATLFSGIGMSNVPESTAGQLFAGFYGIFSNYIYIATSGIILAPIAHRILHFFHLEDDSESTASNL